MPEEIKRGVLKVPDLPRRKSDGFVSIYANNVGSAMTFYDLRLIFGQILFGPGEEPVIEDRCSITMPWEHVLAMRDLLNRVIDNYERDSGKIRPQPENEAKEGSS